MESYAYAYQYDGSLIKESYLMKQNEDECEVLEVTEL